MTTMWILVCDAVRARTFETRNDVWAWKPVKVVVHEESRGNVTELVIGSVGRRAGGAAAAPEETEKQRFARALLAMLDQALRARRFDRWVLVAPPEFAGILRKSMSAPLAKHLLATVEKDLNHLDLHTLAERLRGVVQIPPNELPTLRESARRSN